MVKVYKVEISLSADYIKGTSLIIERDPFMTHCQPPKDESIQEDRLILLSKRIGQVIAEFEVAQEKMVLLQTNTSILVEAQQQRLTEQLAAIERRSHDLAELMSDTGAARFRLATKMHVEQNSSHIDTLNTLFEKQQANFEVQQLKLDDIVNSHMNEMKKAEKRVAFKIQNFIERLNVEEMRELADTSRHMIEQSASNAIVQSQKTFQRFHWKNIALVVVIVMLNTVVMGLYLSDEMPWETHQHAMHERLAGQALLNAWPSLEKETKNNILSYSKKNTHG